MKINGVEVEDTEAEAFESPYARLIVTARSGRWALDASQAAVGCATSIIGCRCEAGMEAMTEEFRTPDGRPGNRLLFFAKSRGNLEKELVKRVGQTLLPAPTVMVFNGLDEGEDYDLGNRIGYFGNRFQKSEKRHGRECVVIPVTSGEFVVEKDVKIGVGVGGANFWIYASSHKAGLRAAEAAVDAIRHMEGLILPFAGGVVAAASRVGSAYPFLKASTQEDFCPSVTQKQNPERKLPKGVEALFEIIIDAVSLKTAALAMSVGIRAACIGGVVKIGAANFGGKLGDIRLPLRHVLEEHPPL